MKCILCGGYIPDGEIVLAKRHDGTQYYVKCEVCENCVNPKKKHVKAKEAKKDIDLDTFNARLSKLYKQSGKTWEEIAIGLGVSRTSLYLYRKGTCKPTAVFIVNAATYFGVTTDYLLGMPGTDDEPSTKEDKQWTKTKK